MSLGKVYLASGWFSPEWLEELENIKSVLDDLDLNYFSPKDENLAKPDDAVSVQNSIFEGNINGMEECDWMICNTRNKDMGSIFEAGYFHKLGKPIVLCSTCMSSFWGTVICTTLLFTFSLKLTPVLILMWLGSTISAAFVNAVCWEYLQSQIFFSRQMNK